jgi:hypothetical protein
MIFTLVVRIHDIRALSAADGSGVFLERRQIPAVGAPPAHPIVTNGRYFPTKGIIQILVILFQLLNHVMGSTTNEFIFSKIK